MLSTTFVHSINSGAMAETGPDAPRLHPALVRNTGYLMSRLGFYASKQFAERLATLGLTPRTWGAINVLDHEGPVTQQQLGRAIEVDPSSVVSAIDELEAKGWVQRRRHPTDRRAHALHITEAGRETLTRARRLAGATQNELLAPLNDSERAQLHDMLLRLAVAAGTVADPIGFRDSPPPAADGD
jgi:DNA-binding MarR family transcriptional regulator